MAITFVFQLYKFSNLIDASDMLNLFIRCLIIYFFLLIAMRLMGKRQLGELQPFEFAITLVASELACIPMSDPTIPISYGIIPVFTLFLAHILITKLAVKNIKFRKILNGKPVIVIEQGNILPKMLKELNMNIDDLMEAIRGLGYFNPNEIEYAIVETNGSLTILPKAQDKPLTPKDLNLQTEKSIMPVTVMMEGRFMGDNISKLQNFDRQKLLDLLKRNTLQKDNVLLMLLENDKVFIQPYNGDSITDNLKQKTELDVNDGGAQ